MPRSSPVKYTKHKIHFNYLRTLSTSISLPKAPDTDSSRTPHQSRRPIPPGAQLPNPDRRIQRRVLIPDQWLQQPPHLPAPRTRRVVVDREDADGAKTTAADDGRLAGQGAVAVDARVGAGGDDGAVAEQAGGGVVDGGVDLRAAGQAGLDEGRVDAGGVFEGGDFGVVDVEAVAEGEESGSVTAVRGELVDEGDGELGVDGGGVRVAGRGGPVDLLVGALGAVAARERDGREGALDGGVGGANGAGEGEQEGA